MIAHLAALRHDLGKYVAMQVRSLPAGADPESLREALRDDVARTRRGPSGTTDAGAVFAELAPALRGEAPLADGSRVDLRGDPDFDALAAAMARLQQALPRLERLEAPALRALAADALDVSQRCRALHRRLQEDARG
ncbi:MAG: hypothetical protein R3F59_35080 [Myxococcota bacterium]